MSESQNQPERTPPKGFVSCKLMSSDGDCDNATYARFHKSHHDDIGQAIGAALNQHHEGNTEDAILDLAQALDWVAMEGWGELLFVSDEQVEKLLECVDDIRQTKRKVSHRFADE